MICPGVILQNRFRVVRQIGCGGFGQVFEVDDGGTLKVLKVLRLERFYNPTVKNKAIALFQREAQLLSKIRHPGIPLVEPPGYFTWSEGTSEPWHCLVMEKIPGTNLEDWLQARGNQPITTEQACEWLIQLVKIIQKLHKIQYFHRDIKPSNIMLRPNGQLVLIDFGAVREVTTSYLQKQKGNETGTVLISAGYTPSEQAEGYAVPQSDFFALGRSFVYLLTGKSPLEFPKNPQTGELIWRDEAKVSLHLADLIDRLMAPFPGQRPQNCPEILQYLQQTQPYSLLSFAQTIPGISSLVSKCNAKDTPRHNKGFYLALASLFLLGAGGLWNFSPSIASQLNRQGFADYKNKRLNAAEFYYKLALVFQPKNPKANYNLGVLYEDRQNMPKARAAYEISVQQGFDKAYNNLARLYILDNKSALAMPLLNSGLPLAQENTTKYAILKNLGWAQMELGRYQEAEINLKRAIDISGTRSSAYCLQALLLERQGNASAIAWDKCVKYNKDNEPDVKQWIASRNAEAEKSKDGSIVSSVFNEREPQRHKKKGIGL